MFSLTGPIALATERASGSAIERLDQAQWLMHEQRWEEAAGSYGQVVAVLREIGSGSPPVARY
jgi:hypothetical protein